MSDSIYVICKPIKEGNAPGSSQCARRYGRDLNAIGKQLVVYLNIVFNFI